MLLTPWETTLTTPNGTDDSLNSLIRSLSKMPQTTKATHDRREGQGQISRSQAIYAGTPRRSATKLSHEISFINYHELCGGRAGERHCVSLNVLKSLTSKTGHRHFFTLVYIFLDNLENRRTFWEHYKRFTNLFLRARDCSAQEPGISLDG